MNRMNYHGRQRRIGIQKTSTLEPPPPPKPMVPDLSLIEYNDKSDHNVDYNRSHFKTATQSVKEKSPAPSNHIEEPDEEVNSYVAWRTKNSHLFKKSSSCENQNQFSSRNPLTCSKSDPTEHLTLLNRITEISERLEKEDINDEECDKSDQELHQIKGSEVPVGNERNLMLYENDDNYKRVQELYNRIFPSDRLKVFPHDNIHDQDTHSSNTDSVTGKQNCETFEVRHPREERSGLAEKNYSPCTKERHYNPKKRVTYECDDLKKVVVVPKYGNNHSNANISFGSNHDDYAYNNSLKCNDTPFNRSSVTQNRFKPNYDHDEYHNESRNDLLPLKKVISYDHNRSRNNFGRQVTREASQRPRDTKHSRNTQCLCPDCPQNISAGSTERYRISHHKCNEQTMLESNSSSEDNQFSGNCCYGKYKKKRKKITIDELYKIVKLQNEQINLLQKQIDRLLEQNNNFKKLFESKQVVPLDPVSTEAMKSSGEQKCFCQNNNNNNTTDKITTQGFSFSVVQENSKVEQQNSVNGNNNGVKKCTNVSIGVMTSFVEVTQRMLGLTPQQFNDGVEINQNYDHGLRNSVHENSNKNDYCQQRGKTTVDNSSPSRFGRVSSCPAVTEESFTLNEVDLPGLPVVVNEHVPTPQCSVHVDIQDYGSTTSSSGSTDDEDSDRSSRNGEEGRASDNGRVGWTLYDNVVGQVNKILQKNGQPNDESNSAVPPIDDVRNATIQQLRRLGVSFIDNDTSTAKKVTFDPVFNRPIENGMVNHFNDVAAHGLHRIDGNRKMNEVPITYLNEEQILQAAINIMNKKKEFANACASQPSETSTPHDNNDVSFATMKYLERYRLLPSGSNNQVQEAVQCNQDVQPRRIKKQKSDRTRPQPHQPQHPQLQFVESRPQQPHYSDHRPQNLLSNKILDITALKQQPKLL